MHNKLNQAWEKIESVQVEKFCKTMDEVINSREFERAFEIVLDKDKKYNKSYFLWLLWKIRNLKELEKKEKEDFLELLDDNNFQEIAEKVYNRVKWLTIEEAGQFLESYPVEDMIFSLRDKVNKRFLETLTYKYELEEEVEINWERFLKISKKDENWNVKKWVIKESEKEQAEEKCVFDDIWKIEEVNWEVYYIWINKYKKWVIKYWDENKIEERCIFDDIYWLQEINWEVYYKAKLWNKWWYILLWDEKNANKYCIFNYIGSLKKRNWEVYYEAQLWNKRWYTKLWEWAYFEYKIEFWPFSITRKKYISLKEEKENNWNDRVAYRR